MRYTDRTRIETDWICPRARYWSTEYKGIGLAPLVTPRELDFGLKMAEQTAHIKRGLPWNVTSFAAGDDTRLAEALLVGYETIVWPRWLQHYDLVAVEEENPKLLAPWLTYNSRPDTLMRRKSDGTLWYGPEDKTTSYVDSLLNYARSVQLHATALAVEERYGEPIAGCLVQGLYKGFERDGGYGKQLNHALVYGYRKEGRPGIIPDQWSTKWVRGWERTPVEQYPGGVREYIKLLKDEELAAIFPNSEPVTIMRGMTEEYFKQVLVREEEIAGAVNGYDTYDTDILRKVFPQHFNQCDNYGGYRKPCWAKDLCYNATTRRFPMTFYKLRQPHHANEAKELKNNAERTEDHR